MGRKTAIIGAIIGAALASPAMASEIMDITLTGTVQSLDDTSGLFAGVSSSDPFTLTYAVDFSKGVLSGGVGGFGGQTLITGGSSEAGDMQGPNEAISPVSAELKVGGVKYDFDGAYLGQVMYVYNDFSDPGVSSATLDADSGGAPGSAFIDTSLASNIWQTFGAISVEQPASFAVDGANITGSTTFNYVVGDAQASGVLTLTSYSARVSPAPEPASWALLTLGLGGIGGAMRVARRRAATAAAAI